ncbi:unnamed protein product [Adineta steineri]|uniref:Glycosyltransferase n=1 Tax=Adineta steineri TaxID=433720 RepID=A0A819I0M8_9BILA|nr:unnamed protein product [Adineta steineri]CAF1474505.1 unnamed protein product [Adineta steineri]CAF3910963.1 unnamed protein product [Adineta steineri]CAF4021458.1 unnamed protein product [Adineta steineri]
MGDIHEIKNDGHVVLIAPPFFGHIIPFLDFAKLLSAYYHITVIVSASKLDTLKQRGLAFEDDNKKLIHAHSGIDLIGIFDHNDADYEISTSAATIDLESISDRMRIPFRQLLSPAFVTSASIPLLATRPIDHPIHLFVADVFLHMLIRDAQERDIMSHIFFSSNFTMISLILGTSTEKLSRAFRPDFASKFLETCSIANGLICHSIDKLEEQAVNDLRQQSLPCSNIPVRFVAPLISEQFDNKQNTDTITDVRQWLDTQWKLTDASPSVIYISFGTVGSLAPEQLVQIANALAPYPVIWSLKAQFHTYLPSSFIDNQKHLLLHWAPQRLILSHPAVHFFLSHGGWNSILECMLAGKPILVWPLFGDQMRNGRRAEQDYKIGQCIRNTFYNGQQRVVASDEITRYLKQMFDQEAEHVENAQKIQKLCVNAKENSSRLYLDEIIKIIDDRVTVQRQKHIGR